MSKRTGPGGVLKTAAAIASTNKTAIATTIKAAGNSINLYVTVGTTGCGTLKFFADVSNDNGATFFTSPVSWSANGGGATAAANYFVPLDGLNVAIGDVVKIWFQASSTTGTPTLAVDYECFDSGKPGSTVLSSGASSFPGALPDTTYYTYTDDSFVTGDSPVVHDINTDLGRNAIRGYFANRGAGDISLKIDSSGAASPWAGLPAIILESGDVFSFEGLDVDQIQVTWVADSAYDVFVV